jgi:cation:H+ antiporter
MLLYASAMFVGFVSLVWGADRMVTGAAVTARNFGLAPMLIGLTVVGFATSAPEILVSMSAALQGSPNLAIGNAIGSNIANIGLVGGAAALVRPLVVKSETLRRELPAMVAVSILPVILMPDLVLGRGDGLILLLAMVGFFYWIVRLGMRTRGRDTLEAEYAAEIPGDVKQSVAYTSIAIGLSALLIGATALVWGAENVALVLGISDLILGLTVVAIGTSLPELAVSVTAARKGHHGLAFGNIIGSNAFNMLAVIGVAAAIHPAALTADVVQLHLPVMLAFTVAFFFMSYNYSDTVRLRRLSGGVLLFGFLMYYGYIAYQTIP